MSVIDKLTEEQTKEIITSGFEYYYDHNVDIIIAWIKKSYAPSDSKELLTATRKFFQAHIESDEIECFRIYATKTGQTLNSFLYLVAILLKDRLLKEQQFKDFRN